MNPIYLFSNFSGRIGRRSFWFGILLLAAVSPFSIRTVISADPVAEALQLVRQLGIVGLAWSLLLLVGVAALMTKRLHDRNRSGVYAALFYFPAALAALTYFLGRVPFVVELEKWSYWIIAFAGTAGIWFLVQLGFFPGTDGPNRFGPAPGS